MQLCHVRSWEENCYKFKESFGKFREIENELHYVKNNTVVFFSLPNSVILLWLYERRLLFSGDTCQSSQASTKAHKWARGKKEQVIPIEEEEREKGEMGPNANI